MGWRYPDIATFILEYEYENASAAELYDALLELFESLESQRQFTELRLSLFEFHRVRKELERRIIEGEI